MSPGERNSCYGNSDIPTGKYCPACSNLAQSRSGVEKLKKHTQRRGCTGNLDKLAPGERSAWRKEAAKERDSLRRRHRRRRAVAASPSSSSSGTRGARVQRDASVAATPCVLASASADQAGSDDEAHDLLFAATAAGASPSVRFRASMEQGSVATARKKRRPSKRQQEAQETEMRQHRLQLTRERSRAALAALRLAEAPCATLGSDGSEVNRKDTVNVYAIVPQADGDGADGDGPGGNRAERVVLAAVRPSGNKTAEGEVQTIKEIFEQGQAK